MHERAATDMRKMTLMFTKPSRGGLPTRTFKDRLTLEAARTASSCTTWAPGTVMPTRSS